jgi:hypothetical protein
MGLFDLFTRKSNGTVSAGRVSLAVLYVIGGDALSSDNAFALRDIIIAAAPIDFAFLNPGSFEVFFPGTEDGRGKVEQLAVTLESFAALHGISSFGVGVQVGPCLVARDAKGQFTSRPVGETISRAMRTAIQEASSAP